MARQNKSIFSEALEIFMHFARSRNLAQTAEAFSISLSSASRQIRKLEATLETDLIVPGKRPFTLTAEGRRFFSKMEQEQRKIDETIDEIRSKDAMGRQLRIGFIESWTQASSTIISNCAENLNFVLNITGTTDRLTGLFNAGEIDAIVTSELPSDIGKLRCWTFLEEPALVVLPKKTLELIPRTPNWKNLSFCGLPYILSYKRSRSGKALFSFLSTNEINFHSRIEVDNIGTKLGLIAEGLGWSLVPVTSLYQNRAMLSDPTLSELRFLPSPTPVFNRRLFLAASPTFNQALFRKLANELYSYSVKRILPWAREKLPEASKSFHAFDPDSGIG